MARQNDSEIQQELNMKNKFELKLRKARGAHRAYETRMVTAASESVKTSMPIRRKSFEVQRGTDGQKGHLEET